MPKAKQVQMRADGCQHAATLAEIGEVRYRHGLMVYFRFASPSLFVRPYRSEAAKGFMRPFRLWDSIPSQKVSAKKGIFTKTFISKAIILLFPPGHVRIFYGPPPTLYADGLSDLCRTCIGGESEVVRS